MSWTKQLPSVSGFYWYRQGDYPLVVDWDAAIQKLEFTGNDWPLPAIASNSYRESIEDFGGEFWSERLIPPT